MFLNAYVSIVCSEFKKKFHPHVVVSNHSYFLSWALLFSYYKGWVHKCFQISFSIYHEHCLFGTYSKYSVHPYFRLPVHPFSYHDYCLFGAHTTRDDDRKVVSNDQRPTYKYKEFYYMLKHDTNKKKPKWVRWSPIFTKRIWSAIRPAVCQTSRITFHDIECVWTWHDF